MTRARHARAGFTLIEVSLALVLFTAIGYGLVVATSAGHDTQAELLRVASENRSLRDSSDRLVEELRTCAATSITVTTLQNGNSELTFQQPIVVGTTLDWGVFDPALGPTEAEQNQPGWSVRFTVTDAVHPDGSIDRQLRRQVLDAGGAVQQDELVLGNLSIGMGPNAGFTVTQTGVVWEVRVQQTGHQQAAHGEELLFHVQPRN